MRTRYKFVEKKGYYFITATVIEWLPLFTDKKYFDIIKNSLDFCESKDKFQVEAYVILENHLHLIISGKNLSNGMRDFKSFTARKIIMALKEDKKEWVLNQLEYYKKQHKTDSKYQIWQEGIHPQLIQGEEMMRQKINYIHHNPVRRGYVNRVEDWVYSSASLFFNED